MHAHKVIIIVWEIIGTKMVIGYMDIGTYIFFFIMTPHINYIILMFILTKVLLEL